jgi:hypothetical protein
MHKQKINFPVFSEIYVFFYEEFCHASNIHHLPVLVEEEAHFW